jgi:uncharacterized protein (TIGR03437 family)
MGAGRKDANEASSSIKDVLRRRVVHWQRYAAVTGSAMAMMTSASAQRFHDIPLIEGITLAMDVDTPQSTQAVGVPIVTLVAPTGSSKSTVQPGEWVSIYGANLGSGTSVWKGDFPTTLGGTSVTINGRAAFLSFVSPGQINLQAPDDSATGPVSVVVTTAAGRASAMVTLAQFSPSFNLITQNHVAAIIVRPNGSGAFGGGLYDILGPTGMCFGYRTVGAQAGDLVELYGVGFGPTTPTVPAGQAYSGAAPVKNAVSLMINKVPVQPSFVGLSSAGLYQINVVVPAGLGSGDVSIQASVGGMVTQTGSLFSLGGGSSSTYFCVGDGDGGDGTIGDGTIGDGMIGDGGDGGDGGTGDGGTGDGGMGDGGDGGDGDGDGGDGGGDGGDGGDGA